MKKLPLILLMTLTLAAAMPPATAVAAQRIEASAELNVADARATSSGLLLTVSHSSDTPVRFMVYSITGQLIKSIDVAAGDEAAIDLPAGYYIVKTAQWSKRLVVR